MSRDASILQLSLGVLLSASFVACATVTPASKLRRVDAPKGIVTRFADLRLEPGTLCVVTLAGGSVLQGRLDSVSADALVLAPDGRPGTTGTRTMSETDVVSVGRVAGMSKPARAWLGAGIGVLVSLPLSISSVGDASVIGALVGSWVGRNIGDAHVVILFER
jgi:hypothetical protein